MQINKRSWHYGLWWSTYFITACLFGCRTKCAGIMDTLECPKKYVTLPQSNNLCSYGRRILFSPLILIGIGTLNLSVYTIVYGFFLFVYCCFVIANVVTIPFGHTVWPRDQGKRTAKQVYSSVVRVRGETIYPGHVLLLAGAVYGITVLDSVLSKKADWINSNVTSGIGFIIVGLAGLILFRFISRKYDSSETKKIVTAYFKAKKEKHCPLIEFIEN